MKTIQAGIIHQINRSIRQKDSAKAFGSGDVDVFATPAMIALMEETALKSIEPYLENSKTTVGFEVNIRHFKGVKIGEVVNCYSILLKAEKNKLIFEVKVMHNEVTVGSGTHTRYIVDKADFV